MRFLILTLFIFAAVPAQAWVVSCNDGSFELKGTEDRKIEYLTTAQKAGTLSYVDESGQYSGHIGGAGGAGGGTGVVYDFRFGEDGGLIDSPPTTGSYRTANFSEGDSSESFSCSAETCNDGLKKLESLMSEGSDDPFLEEEGVFKICADEIGSSIKSVQDAYDSVLKLCSTITAAGRGGNTLQIECKIHGIRLAKTVIAD